MMNDRPSQEEQRLRMLAGDHYRNARRLAERLVAAEDELRRLKTNPNERN